MTNYTISVEALGDLSVDLGINNIRIPLTQFVEDLHERLANETATRPERISKLSNLVDAVFVKDNVADLRDEICSTFNVPQFGKYHNEGLYMDSHLALILKTIESIKSGDIDLRVPDDIGEILKATVRTYFLDLIRYTFLHDLEKPSCITVFYKNGQNIELNMERCYQIISEECKENCQLAYDSIENAGIEKISYYH